MPVVFSKAGWSWGWVSAVDSQGRTIWIADAHRDGKRFVVRAYEKLTAFLELELGIPHRTWANALRGGIVSTQFESAAEDRK